LLEAESVLTGKIRSTSKRELLMLETRSLEHVVALLEQENAELEALLAASSSSDPLSVLTKAHSSLRGLHDQLVRDRQQGAVDIVEFVFRALNTRPPPRQRQPTAITRAGRGSISGVAGLISPSHQYSASATSYETVATSPSRPNNISVVRYAMHLAL